MDNNRLPLTDHLIELRNRLSKILLAWTVGSIAAWNFREPIFSVLLQPALEALGPNGALQAIAPTEIFFTYLKCALLAGFILALPLISWQIWSFISPGLYDTEKKAALPFALISTLLFIGGAAFGHFVVFPLIYLFFAGFSSDLVTSAWTMKEVFSLTTRLVLAFGIGFELPVAVFFLASSGLVSPRRLLAGTKYGVLIAFALGAILTPPDIVSQILLAAPLTVLYLLGVAAGYLFARQRKEN